MPVAPSSRPRQYGRWRAASLIAVYVLIGLHIAHWKISGRTLAPLELNEVIYTLELGVVTAGFLFMSTVCLGTLIFGRFFCSWGCHILALEDLCAWLLEKIRLRPKPVRSRLMLLVPPAAMFYMFLWPQISRIVQGRELPSLHLRTDAQGWGSLTTENFWRNLPGPWVAGLTFAICGFLIIYVLGSRSFCTYACPYGAIFKVLDRFAPGRIVALADCSGCGICTAACSSHVRVHEELVKYGTVVNPACLRDLDCVSACPNGEIGYRFTRPPALRSWFSMRTIRPPFDFAWWEEVLLLACVGATLLIFRGLYDSVPFLMTLGLGAIVAYLGVVLLRLAWRRDVRLNLFLLKRAGRLSGAGAVYVGASAVFAGFAGHSAFIRLHEFRGYRAAQQVMHATRAESEPGLMHTSAGQTSPVGAAQLTPAITDLETCYRWGLVHSPRLVKTLAELHSRAGSRLANAAEFGTAAEHFRRSILLMPSVAQTRYNLGVVLAAEGNDVAAVEHYRAALALDPNDPDICNNLGFTLARSGRLAEAEAVLRASLERHPAHADMHFNLARVLVSVHPPRQQEAEEHFRAAARLHSGYAELLGLPAQR